MSGRRVRLRQSPCLRSTLVQLGQQRCQTAEEFKAWSQNLGHEEVLTTLYSYGYVAEQRQGEIIQAFVAPRPTGRPDVDAIADALLLRLREQSAAL